MITGFRKPEVFDFVSCVSLIQNNEEEQTQSIVILKCIKIDKR